MHTIRSRTTTAHPDRQLLPLAVAALAIAAAIVTVWQMWKIAVKVKDRTMQTLERKNVTLSKDGVRVGYQQIQSEQYVDQTQQWVVKAWNFRRDSAASARKGKK